jgi:hypothetical protein
LAAALDQPRRRGGLHDCVLTGAAGVLRSADDQNSDLGRYDVEALGYILADAVQRSRAARAHEARNVHNGLHPWQVARQRSSVHPTLGGPGRLLGRRGLFNMGVPGGLDLLGFFQSQQELVLGQALGAPSETVTLESLDDLAQPLALGALLQKHHLQQAGIVRKGRSGRGHKRMRSCFASTCDRFDALARAFLLSSAQRAQRSGVARERGANPALRVRRRVRLRSAA